MLTLRVPHKPTGAGGAGARYNCPHVKAHVLLQAHLSRTQLPAELQADTARVLTKVRVVFPSHLIYPTQANTARQC